MRYVFSGLISLGCFFFSFAGSFNGRILSLCGTHATYEFLYEFPSWQRECDSGEERSVRLNRRICNGCV